MIPNTLAIHFDGATHPNPGGTPRFGWHIDDDDGNRLAEKCGVHFTNDPAERTNNTAEWAGLLSALAWLACLRNPIDSLRIYGDSQLVIHQLEGRMKCKKPHLIRFRDECRQIIKSLDVGHVEAIWIPREKNSQADALAGASLYSSLL